MSDQKISPTDYAAVVDKLTNLAHYERDEGLLHFKIKQDTYQTVHQQIAQSPMTNAPSSSSAEEKLQRIAKTISNCTICPLCTERTNTVPGQGSSNPELMFIGEGPGAEEDKQGLAFVGRSGQLLTKIIEAMGFSRDEVFIGNIVKCRPPGNRAPMPDEMEACMPYLKQQIALLQPKVIVCLGATAVKGLLDTKVGITKTRGQWRTFEGIDTMPTYHPAYLLRNPPAKKEVWEDMQEVVRHMGRSLPPQKEA